MPPAGSQLPAPLEAARPCPPLQRRTALMFSGELHYGDGAPIISFPGRTESPAGLGQLDGLAFCDGDFQELALLQACLTGGPLAPISVAKGAGPGHTHAPEIGQLLLRRYCTPGLLPQCCDTPPTPPRPAQARSSAALSRDPSGAAWRSPAPWTPRHPRCAWPPPRPASSPAPATRAAPRAPSPPRRTPPSRWRRRRVTRAPPPSRAGTRASAGPPPFSCAGKPR